MYRPQRSFKQLVPYLVVGVQTSCLDQYTSCSVGNEHIKFQGCTVDVQNATSCKQSVPYLVVGVKTSRLDQYTSCSVVNVDIKFQDCTVDVQAVTEF